ncbi:MAG: glucuronate isomerase [Clostridia bacterium]|nr:glucuronate isomerase [Clostridia bacterium]
MSYIKDNFLLTNKTAVRLYEKYAKNMPIFDYHCHLPEKQILENKPFSDIYEIWLSGDHYKWRLMRNYGVDEAYITGDKSNKEKFVAYCKTLGTAFGNPLYHWSQVELKDFFNCELEINEENAEQIWDWCNEFIALNNITPQKLIEQSNVSHLFTTNEIFDDLSTFPAIAQKGYNFKVIPAFRADKLMGIESPMYKTFMEKLEALTGKIANLDDLEKAIEQRLCDFIEVGTTASDIAVEYVYPITEKGEANAVFEKALAGAVPTEAEAEVFKGYLTYFLFKLYAKHNIATELHLGATRNNNSVMFAKLGADTGYDGMSDQEVLRNLTKLFDRLNSENALPKTIVFNLNPKMNSELVVLLGCFQSGEAKGKMQYGPAWWFLDNKVGMERHLQDLTATGHIGAFVGMLTDSRSFLSYPRHHYFRRILCNYFGTMMERGEMTQDEAFVGKVVEDISYNNSIAYLNMK